MIDWLALWVGNEKGEDEADTVGCCSLWKEHIEIGENNTIILDFLGKDSMRYHNTIDVDPRVHKAIKKFVQGKKPSDDLFDLIKAQDLNEYLKTMMNDLSAKVFWTYNASWTLQEQLLKEELKTDNIDEKVKFYEEANRQVAILCNH